MKSCIYPGTFDPITNGHLDVIKRASNVFDRVIVAVALNESKTPYFNYNQRIELAKIATNDLNSVEVIGFDNLLVDFAKSLNINTVVRGLRAVSDFEYELQIGYANVSLWNEFETVYFMPSLKNAFISSSIVRSVLRHNGDASSLIPAKVYQQIKEYYAN
ncbi:pantetheine-phosphate adenylyltransferase [Campylobacter lanienae]|uniref:pantetheine-phosphate adenylyltransferase n=1 Tax=Campylobacter lanienae TaxID=75658 RepID=UPI0011AB9A53|nr:pantetheine-phosphate adenylyltransferase [Campylobacter lanienae]TWO15486.1 pantetheine-phosphate adenylyltransferase [Campylobacter lanienae]